MVFASLFSSCTQTEWLQQQQLLRRHVAEAPASDLSRLLSTLASPSGHQDDALSLFTSRMDTTTGSTIWHLAAERTDHDALRQLHAAWTSLTSTTASAASRPAPLRAALPLRAPKPSHTHPWTIPDKQGRTPLMICAQHGKGEAVADLLSWGANPLQEKDKRGRTALHLASQSGRADVLRLLLRWAKDNDPTIDSQPLQAAAQSGRTASNASDSVAVGQQGTHGSGVAGVEGLVQQEASGQGTTEAPSQAEPGASRLHLPRTHVQGQQGDVPQGPATALGLGHVPALPSPRGPGTDQAAAQIADQGTAQPQGQQQEGVGHEEESQQEPGQRPSGERVLATTSVFAHAREALVSELGRCMVCAADACGLTPLHYAAAADDVPSCQLLLACGACITATSSQASYDNALPCNPGMTPLHIAAMGNSFKAAHALLVAWNRLTVQERVRQFPLGSRNADGPHSLSMDPRTILDKEGKTACVVAASRRFDVLAELLDPSSPMPGGVSLPDTVGPNRPTPPSMLCCPITMDLMEDPVVISDGFSYERAAIEKWLVLNSTSPLTNVPLANKVVFPNRMLRQAISEWRVAHGLGELPPVQELKSPTRTSRHGGRPVLRGGMGDGFIREMADGGLAHGRRA